MLLSTIDLQEGINDTPRYRAQLAEYDQDVSQFDVHVKALVKCLRDCTDLSQAYGRKMEALSQLLDAVPAFLSPKQNQNENIFGVGGRKTPDVLEKARHRVASGLRDIEKSRNMLHLHINDVFLNPLESIIKDGVPRIKESKRKFDKLSDEHDTIIGKYMNKKENDLTLDETHSEYLRQRGEFRDLSLEYAQELKEFQMLTQIEMTENTLSFMYAFQTFYHQGYEILKDSDPALKDLTERLQKMRGLMKKDGEEASQLQELLLNSESGSEGGADEGLFTSCQSGYLFLKSDQRYFESWNRYYFKIEDDTLLYYNRDKALEAVGSIDLKLCTVKAANTDRRFCFLLISNSKTYLLQAETEARVKLWIATLHRAIENALKFNRSHLRAPSGASHSVKHDASSFDQMRSLPGNDCCADCKADSPTWACINFGTLICIECSGIHRSFGVHISKIRSLTLDNWEPALVEIMLALGNLHVNRITEHQILHAVDVDTVLSEAKARPITANSSREEKTNWITAKYVSRQFCPPQAQDPLEIAQKMIDTSDYPSMLHLILQGATIETLINGSTILHRAVMAGDLTRLEFLLMWTSNVDLVDGRGRTPLHLAATTANPRLVWFLLQKGADWDLRDKDDKLPLDYAMQVPDVPVVMAFRYFVFLKQSNPRLSKETNFGFDQAMELFGTTPE